MEIDENLEKKIADSVNIEDVQFDIVDHRQIKPGTGEPKVDMPYPKQTETTEYKKDDRIERTELKELESNEYNDGIWLTVRRNKKFVGDAQMITAPKRGVHKSVSWKLAESRHPEYEPTIETTIIERKIVQDPTIEGISMSEMNQHDARNSMEISGGNGINTMQEIDGFKYSAEYKKDDDTMHLAIDEITQQNEQDVTEITEIREATEVTVKRQKMSDVPQEEHPGDTDVTFTLREVRDVTKEIEIPKDTEVTATRLDMRDVSQGKEPGGTEITFIQQGAMDVPGEIEIQQDTEVILAPKVGKDAPKEIQIQKDTTVAITMQEVRDVPKDWRNDEANLYDPNKEAEYNEVAGPFEDHEEQDPDKILILVKEKHDQPTEDIWMSVRKVTKKKNKEEIKIQRLQIREPSKANEVRVHGEEIKEIPPEENRNSNGPEMLEPTKEPSLKELENEEWLNVRRNKTFVGDAHVITAPKRGVRKSVSWKLAESQHPKYGPTVETTIIERIIVQDPTIEGISVSEMNEQDARSGMEISGKDGIDGFKHSVEPEDESTIEKTEVKELSLEGVRETKRESPKYLQEENESPKDNNETTPESNVWITVKKKQQPNNIRLSRSSSSSTSIDGSVGASSSSTISSGSAQDPWISVRRKNKKDFHKKTIRITKENVKKEVESIPYSYDMTDGRNGVEQPSYHERNHSPEYGEDYEGFDQQESFKKPLPQSYSMEIRPTNQGPIIMDTTSLDNVDTESNSSHSTDMSDLKTLPWIEVRQRNSIKKRLSFKRKKPRYDRIKGLHTKDGNDRLLLLKIPPNILTQLENNDQTLDTEVEIPWVELDQSAADETSGYLPWIELTDKARDEKAERLLMLKIPREMILKASKSSTNQENEIQLPWNEVIKYLEATGQITAGSTLGADKGRSPCLTLTFPSETEQSKSPDSQQSIDMPDIRLVLPKKYCLESSLQWKPMITVNQSKNIKVQVKTTVKRKHDWKSVLRLSKSDRHEHYSDVNTQDRWVILADGTAWWRLQVDDMDDFNKIKPRSDGRRFKNTFEIGYENTDEEDINLNEFTKELGQQGKTFCFVIDPKSILQ